MSRFCLERALAASSRSRCASFRVLRFRCLLLSHLLLKSFDPLLEGFPLVTPPSLIRIESLAQLLLRHCELLHDLLFGLVSLVKLLVKLVVTLLERFTFLSAFSDRGLQFLLQRGIIPLPALQIVNLL